MKITKGLVLSLAALALAANWLTPSRAQADDMETLHFSYPESNAFYWDFDVAREKGFFKDEKFELSHITGASTPQVIQMLISGDLTLVTPQPDALMVAMSRGGKDLAVIAQPALMPDWILVGSKNVKSFADIKGKTLGVSALHGSEQTLAEQVLAENGVKKGDFNVIVAGLTPSKYAALQTGSIAVAVLYQPTAQLALKEGFPALFRFTKLKEAYPPSYYATNRKWAAEKDHGRRIARVITRAHNWLWDPKNRDEAISILQKYTKRDKVLLGEIYNQYFVTDKLYSPDAKVRMVGVQTIIDDMVSRGDLKKGAVTPEQVILPANIGGLNDAK
jgi:ABC-type nitrate/sulfonate/bicarbonate transport system substrate-binding protein